MSILEFAFRCMIYAMVVVILGILIGDLGNRNRDATESALVVSELKPDEILQALPTSSVAESLNEPPKEANEKPEPYRERLKRFDTFRSKVLLKDDEAMEKQRLLAHVKTIQWIERQLSISPDNGTDALGDRLTMIDFYEEALAWKDNPVRSEVLDSVERTLKVNNLLSGAKETKQMLAGDKIELFAVLAEQDPGRAKVILEGTKDKQLTKIFQYAIKRLALQKLSGEAR